MSDAKAPAKDEAPAMTKEDIAYFIRIIWESLLKPMWVKGDLIDLGMAVYAKTTLAKMDQKKLSKLLPNLSLVVEHFAMLLRAKYAAEFDAFLKEQGKEPLALSREDIAYYIKGMWEALLKPTWLRADLIDLGTAVHDKVTLSKMDPERLDKLLPNLSIVAEYLGNKVVTKFSAEFDAFLQAQEIAHQADIKADPVIPPQEPVPAPVPAPAPVPTPVLNQAPIPEQPIPAQEVDVPAVADQVSVEQQTIEPPIDQVAAEQVSSEPQGEPNG